MTQYFVLQSMIEGVDLFMGQDFTQTDYVILHMGNNTATIDKLMGNQITFFSITALATATITAAIPELLLAASLRPASQ